MPDNATIYIADPSLLGSKLFGQSERIRSYEDVSERGSATGIKFKLDAGEIAVNFMPEAMMEEHLQGFCAYAEHVIPDKDRLVYVLSRIHHVRLVLGCTITPGFDDAGSIQEFLFEFNGLLNGLLFLADTIFDYDGEALGGPLANQES